MPKNRLKPSSQLDDLLVGIVLLALSALIVLGLTLGWGHVTVVEKTELYLAELFR